MSTTEWIATYSAAQPQVYNLVRATRKSRKRTHEYFACACARHASAQPHTRTTKLASVRLARTHNPSLMNSQRLTSTFNA